MKRPALILTALMLGLTGSLGYWTESRAADEAAPAESARSEPAKWDDGQKLSELSKASQALYKKISSSIVRVKIENSFGGGAPAQLMKEFEEWRQKQGAGPARRERPERPDRPERPERAERPDRRAEPSPAVTTMPTRGGGGGGGGGPAAFRKFLEQKLKDSPDPEAQGRLRAILARMENNRGPGGAPANETTGVVIDDQGHTLVALGFGGFAVRENTATFRVTTSDGTEVGAKYVGAHTGRGMAVIKLDSPGIAIPLAMADGRPAGGEMLMCMHAREGSLAWIAAPGQPATHVHPTTKRATDERFPISSGDERGVTYLFNTNGELAAVGTERFAVPVEVLKNDIQWIIKNGKDISPRRLGVKYDPVSPDMRKSLAILADKPAVLVKEVSPGSPADKAGLKKGDILVTIDDVSVALFPQIQVDLATRHGNVVMGIIRSGQEKNLDMPLGEK